MLLRCKLDGISLMFLFVTGVSKAAAERLASFSSSILSESLSFLPKVCRRYSCSFFDRGTNCCRDSVLKSTVFENLPIVPIPLPVETESRLIYLSPMTVGGFEVGIKPMTSCLASDSSLSIMALSNFCTLDLALMVRRSAFCEGLISSFLGGGFFDGIPCFR